MSSNRSATKRRRCGSGLVPPRQTSSSGDLGGVRNASWEKENASSVSAPEGSAAKRACFRKPRTPLRYVNPSISNTTRERHAAVAYQATPNQSGPRRPCRIVVTPPSRLLSSFSKLTSSTPQLSDLHSPGRDGGVDETPRKCLELSMNCSFDNVLDSQIFGLVDELEERNQSVPSSNRPRWGVPDGSESREAAACSLHDSVVQQLFTPDQAPLSVSNHQSEDEPTTDLAGVQQPASGDNSASRSSRLQAGLKSLQSPDLPVSALPSVGAVTRDYCVDQATTNASSARCSEKPAETLTTADKAELSLAAWGIPDSVVKHFCSAGVSHLFPWQAECLLQRDVLAGRNLVYSAPTSGGKSLVAELLLLKRVLETRRRAILILPFVSVAREKARHLQLAFANVGIRVGAFVGSETPRGGFTCVDVAVCTIERANSLVNRLLEEGRVSELCMLVVDELHMLGDSHRGYLLELLLTKVQFVSLSRSPALLHSPSSTTETASSSHPAIQIVGMSATLPNLPTVARWLNAELFCTDFRPVPLTQFIKAGGTVFDSELKQVRSVKGHKFKEDDDDMFYLCYESLSAGHGVLVFCPTKARCEKLALAMAEMAYRYCPPPNTEEKAALTGIMDQLRATPVGLDSVLAKVLPYAIAFHHAGLTMEERDILESGFRRQTLRLLVATSTLASGVNLPARRVIIRTPHFHGKLVDILAYHQMSGRAGRKGLDTVGESFMICKSSEKNRIHALLTSALSPVHSCLAGQNDSEEGKAAGMQRALLEIIVSRVASSHADVLRYACNTLLAAEESNTVFSQTSCTPSSSGQSGSSRKRSGSGRGKRSSGRRSSAASSTPLQKTVTSALTFLLDNEFIAVREESSTTASDVTAASSPVSGQEASRSQSHIYYATQLGSATLSSALSPGEALEVFAELQRAQKCFVLENELHVIYQVTPIYLQAQWPGLDWYRFLCLWSKLPADLQRVGDLVGVEEAFLVNAVHGSGVGKAKTARAKCKLLVHRRFYTALALHDLVHEMPLAEVAAKYSASRGLLQTLQQAAATFAGMVTVFCAALGWHNLQLLLDQFQSRLVFGVERQLCDLLRISLLDASTARALYNSNLHTVQAVAAADVSTIESILRQCSPFRSNKLHQDPSGNSGNTAAFADSATMLAKRRFCRNDVYRDLTDAKAAVIILQEAKTLVGTTADGLALPGHNPSLDAVSAALHPVNENSSSVQNVRPVAQPLRSDKDMDRAHTAKASVASDDRDANRPTINATSARVNSIQSSNSIGTCSENDACLAVHHPGKSRSFRSECGRAENGIDRPGEYEVPKECGLVPSGAAGAAVCEGDDSVYDCSAEELQALAEAMEAGAASGALFSGSKSEQDQRYAGFVSASRLLTGPNLRNVSGNTSKTATPVAPGRSTGHTHSSGLILMQPCRSVRSVDGTSFSTSRMVCSTPVDVNSAPYCRPQTFTEADNRHHPQPEVQSVSADGNARNSSSCALVNNRSVSPDLVTASMLMNASNALFDQSQDLFSEAEHRSAVSTESTKSKNDPVFARNDSEGFDVEPCVQCNVPGESTAASSKPDLITGENGFGSREQPCVPPFAMPDVTESTAGLQDDPHQNIHAAGESIQLPVQMNSTEFGKAQSIDLFQDLFSEEAGDDSLLREASQSLSLTPASEKSYSVIDVCGHRRLVRTFLREWSSQKAFAVAFATQSCQSSNKTASVLAVTGTSVSSLENGHLTLSEPSTQLCGISVCWQASEIFYISLLPTEQENEAGGDGEVTAEERVAIVERLLCDSRRTGTVYSFDIKESCRLLSDTLSLLIEGNVCDVRLSAWLMNPDRNQRTFSQLVRDELPDCCQHGQDSLYYLATTPNRPARLASVAKASLTWQLMQHFQPLLIAEDLWSPLVETECRAALSFARMELCGMGANPAECTKQQQVLQQRLSELEEQAFAIAGHSFALTSPADVSNVLFHELNLPPDLGNSTAVTTRTRSGRGGRTRGGQRLQRFSTNKEVLVKLSSLHPLPAILLEWRRINSALTKVVFPLRQELKDHSGLGMSRIHCIVQLHTATGRIALSDPNVQNVPKEFSISVDMAECGFIDQTFVSMICPPSTESSVVVMRDFFVPCAGHVMLAADYSQLELRLLAHLSNDPKLSTILHSGGDVFRSMASEWLHTSPADVSTEQRQQAKQVCYGMLYGISAKGLAVQLNVDVNAASKFISSFKQTYSVVTQYMESVVRRCRTQGYVTTIGGRKRFLPAIVSTSPAARSQAERQAVNTTIQGSAADLVKTAMINIDEELGRRYGSVYARHHQHGAAPVQQKRTSDDSAASSAAFIILQLHDELMYEVREELLEEVGQLVKREMESALSLSVPMPVKLKCGRSWGQLKDWAPTSS